MRTNLVPNPRNSTNTQLGQQWTNLGTGFTVGTTSIALAPLSSSVAVTVAASTAAGAADVGFYPSTVAGNVYTASVWVYVPSTNGVPVVLNQYFGTVGTASTVYDQWQQLSVTFTAISGNMLSLTTTAAAGTTGFTFYVCMPLCELGTTVGTYFDGGYASATYQADGTSLLLNNAPVRTNNLINPGFENGTGGWGVSNGNAGEVSNLTTVLSDRPYSVLAGRFTVTTPGTSTPYIYTANAHDVPVNVPVTFSAWVRPSVTTSMYLYAYFWYTQSPSANASYTGPVVSCPGGVWTRLSYTHAAPSTGAHHAGTMVRPSVVQAAGWHVDVDDCLVEVGTTLGDFFDGGYPNAVAVGDSDLAQRSPQTAKGASQLSSAPMQNPNMPVIEVSTIPRLNPINNTGSGIGTPIPFTGLWLLTDRVNHIKTTRGRQYELDTDAAGSMTISADDSDAAVSTAMGITDPIALSASWQGTTHELWTGFVNDIPSLNLNAANARAEVGCVDAFEAFSNYTMQGIMQEAIKASSPAPDLYLPLDDKQADLAILSPSGAQPDGLTAPIVNFTEISGSSVGSVAVKLGSDALTTNGTASVEFSNLWTGSGQPRASQIQIAGAQNNYGYILDMSKPWTIELVAAIGTGTAGQVNAMTLFAADTLYGTHLANGSAPFLSVAFTSNTGNPPATSNQGIVHCRVGTSDVSLNSGYFSGATLNKGVLIAISYNGSTATLTVNGQATSAAVSSTSLGWAQLLTLGCEFADNGYLTTPTFDSGTWIKISHCAIWSSALSSTTLQDHYAAYNAYFNETGLTRVTRIAKWAGLAAPSGIRQPSDNGDTEPFDYMADTSGQTALTAIQDVCNALAARFVIQEGGEAYYADRNHGMTNPTPVATFGPGAGQIHWTGMPTIKRDTQHLYNDVQVTSNRSNRTFVDRASVALHFDRVLQLTAPLLYTEGIRNLASYLAGRYSDPIDRVSTVTVDLGADPSLFSLVLPLAVGDPVQMVYPTFAGSRTFNLIVDKVEHDITPSSWTVNFELTPQWQYWVLAYDHTTIKTTIAAGATSVQLNPFNEWGGSCPGEAHVVVGSQVTLSVGSANAETMTVASVTTDVPGSGSYNYVTVTFTAATTKAHNAGEIYADKLNGSDTDPTTWDARSDLGFTTDTQW